MTPLTVVGAGLPRTGTKSLKIALEQLLNGRCYHMREIPNHPFDLGENWQIALTGSTPDWDVIYEGYVAAVDWPTSNFWQEISAAYPDALVLLSVRDSAQAWFDSIESTILPYARMSQASDWKEGRDLVTLFQQFTGTPQWDNPETLMAAYERHNDAVRNTVSSNRFLEWNAKQGWEPLCAALDLPIPDIPFPWSNKRDEWNAT